ncbi:MAG: GntR family transcriptional regulator [Solirubrobacterales bacterium]|nr:GntR family transcriptional regulator [Solirubrobacterales bacterium]
MDPRLLLSTLGTVSRAVPAEIAQRTGVDEEHVAAALAGLERGGFVQRDGEGAYRLPPRSEGEARELYVVAILLEGIALRSCPRFSPEDLAALRAANDRLRAATGEAEAVDADDDFHRLLVASCGNEQLIESHTAAKAALLRYERTYFNDKGRNERSAAEHDAVVEALERGDHAAAAGAVRRNFESSLPDLTRDLS